MNWPRLHPDASLLPLSSYQLQALACLAVVLTIASNAASAAAQSFEVEAGRSLHFVLNELPEHKGQPMTARIAGWPRFSGVPSRSRLSGTPKLVYAIPTVANSGDYLDPGRYGVEVQFRKGDPQSWRSVGTVRILAASSLEQRPERQLLAAQLNYLRDDAASSGRAPILPLLRSSRVDADSTGDGAHPPAPFEPVRYEDGWLHVVNRSVRLDRASGYPARIESNGHAISDRGSGWRRMSGAVALEPASSYRRKRSGPKRAVWQATSEYPDLTIRTELELEYDGFLRFRSTLLPGEDGANIDSLAFVQPLLPEHTKFLSRLGVGTARVDKSSPSWSVADEYDVLEVSAGCRELPFSFQYTISGERLGLLFAVETNERWVADDSNGAFRICRHADRASFEIVFIDSPLDLKEPLSYEFALQILPVRPLPTAARMAQFNTAQFPDPGSLYRRRFHERGSLRETLGGIQGGKAADRSAYSAAVDAGLSTLVVHQGWTEIQGYPGTRDKRRLQQLERFVDDAHGRGLRVLLYVGRELSEAAPEWQQADSIAALPLRFGRSRGNVRAVRPAGAEAAWTEMLIRRIRTLRDTVGIDGVFLDLVAEPDVSMNRRAGLGYESADGALHGALPLFGNRLLMRRIYEIFHPEAGASGDDTRGIVACHANGPHRPAHAFCDYVLAGEAELAEARRHPDRARARLADPTGFRVVYSPRLRGVPVVWLSKPARGGFDMNANAALTLLHDVPQRVQWPHFIERQARVSMLNDPDDVHRHWRLWANHPVADFHASTWYPYWSNSGYVKGLPPGTFTSFRLQPNGTVLAVISNLTERSQSVSVHYDLHALGFDGRLSAATDLLDNVNVGLAGGRVTLDVASMSFRLLELEFR